jgi:hypothetical protein
MNIKRTSLYVLIASVTVSAVLGIAVILFGNFGQFEQRILATTSIITMTSIFGLACGAYLETGRGTVLPYAGIGFAVVSGVLWIAFTWAEVNDESSFARVGFTATLFAVACSLLSLLSLARLDARFLWTRYAVFVFAGTLSLLIFLTIWDLIDPNSDLTARIFGINSIIVAALTIVTPVLHKLSGGNRSAEDIDAEIARLKTRIAELEGERVSLGADGEEADDAG